MEEEWLDLSYLQNEKSALLIYDRAFSILSESEHQENLNGGHLMAVKVSSDELLDVGIDLLKSVSRPCELPALVNHPYAYNDADGYYIFFMGCGKAQEIIHVKIDRYQERVSVASYPKFSARLAKGSLYNTDLIPAGLGVRSGANPHKPKEFHLAFRGDKYRRAFSSIGYFIEAGEFLKRRSNLQIRKIQKEHEEEFRQWIKALLETPEIKEKINCRPSNRMTAFFWDVDEKKNYGIKISCGESKYFSYTLLFGRSLSEKTGDFYTRVSIEDVINFN